MWPEGADGKLCLHPALGDDPRHIPDRVSLGPAVHLHIDIQGSRAGPVAAGEVVMEIDTVGVILLQGRQEKVGLLARGPPRAVHHHEGAWRATKGMENRDKERKKENPSDNQAYPSMWGPEIKSLYEGPTDPKEATSQLQERGGILKPAQQGV